MALAKCNMQKIQILKNRRIISRIRNRDSISPVSQAFYSIYTQTHLAMNQKRKKNQTNKSQLNCTKKKRQNRNLPFTQNVNVVNSYKSKCRDILSIICFFIPYFIPLFSFFSRLFSTNLYWDIFPRFFVLFF